MDMEAEMKPRDGKRVQCILLNGLSSFAIKSSLLLPPGVSEQMEYSMLY